MTSSAEELSTTLLGSYRYKQGAEDLSTGQHNLQRENEKSQQCWVPIDVPQHEETSAVVPIERPEPTKITRSNKKKESKNTKTNVKNRGKDSGSNSAKQCESLCDDLVDRETEPGFSWTAVSIATTASSNASVTDSKPLTLTLEKTPPHKSVTATMKGSLVTSGVTTGTSDDDAYAVTEVKKERKKKKRRQKNGGGNGDGSKTEQMISSFSKADDVDIENTCSVEAFDDMETNLSVADDVLHTMEKCIYDEGKLSTATVDTVPDEDSLDVDVDHFKSTPPEDSEPATLPVTLCVDENEMSNVNVTYPQAFQADDPFVLPLENIEPDEDEDSYDYDGNLSTTRKVDTLDDFELHQVEDVENGNKTTAAQLTSVHSEEDLAKALEEACSDDDAIQRRKSSYISASGSHRSQRVSELYPYRVSSSDECDEEGNGGGGKIQKWPHFVGASRLERKITAMSTDVENENTGSTTSLPLPSESSCSALTTTTAITSADDMSTDDRGSDDPRATGSDSSLNTSTLMVSKSKKKKKKRR